MRLLRRWRAEQVDVPAPRGEEETVPLPTEAELARKHAEVELSREVRRTAEVKAETPRIVGLGERLGVIYKTNHIREDVLALGAALRSSSDGSR